MESFGQKLKIQRKSKTQEQVAEDLIIPRGTYAHYELGKREPNYKTLVRIARYFGVSIDYLLGNEDFRKEIQ